jgi:hypothetical protein
MAASQVLPLAGNPTAARYELAAMILAITTVLTGAAWPARRRRHPRGDHDHQAPIPRAARPGTRQLTSRRQAAETHSGMQPYPGPRALLEERTPTAKAASYEASDHHEASHGPKRKRRDRRIGTSRRGTRRT